MMYTEVYNVSLVDSEVKYILFAMTVINQEVNR